MQRMTDRDPEGTAAKLAPSRVRMRGILLLCGGAAAFIAYVAVWSRFAHSSRIDECMLLLLPFPVVIILKGLLEAFAGTTFSDMNARWMGLNGWERGVIGLLVVLPASGIALWLIVMLIKAFGWLIFR